MCVYYMYVAIYDAERGTHGDNAGGGAGLDQVPDHGGQIEMP